MNRRAGFTLIELLITITIMAILLTLAVVNLRSNQANARDEKRKSDIAVIVQQLEGYYTSGSDTVAASGSYPPTSAMNSESNITSTLRDIDIKALRAPNVATSSPVSLTVATSTAQPSPSTSTYVYQPLTDTGTLCASTSDECRRFIVYYQLETVSGVQSVVSKNQ